MCIYLRTLSIIVRSHAIGTLTCRGWSLTLRREANRRKRGQTWILRVRKVSDPGGSVIERVSGSQNHGAFASPSLVIYPCFLPPSRRTTSPPTTHRAYPPTSSRGIAVTVAEPNTRFQSLRLGENSFLSRQNSAKEFFRMITKPKILAQYFCIDWIKNLIN